MIYASSFLDNNRTREYEIQIVSRLLRLNKAIER